MGKAKQSQSIWEILLNLLRNKEDWGTTVDKSQAKCLAVNLSACLLSVYIILVRANWFWYPRRKWQYWVRIERKGGCSLFPQGKLAPVPPNSMYTLCQWVGLPSCHSCDWGWCGSAYRFSHLSCQTWHSCSSIISNWNCGENSSVSKATVFPRSVTERRRGKDLGKM